MCLIGVDWTELCKKMETLVCCFEHVYERFRVNSQFMT
jgi:hypothetical protein